MTDATEPFVLISGSSIDVDADARERSRKRLSGHTDAIWKFSDLIEFDRILSPVNKMFRMIDC